MSQAQRYADDILTIQKKSEQTLRILGTLWERRLDALSRYFRKRYGFKFLFWQGKQGTGEEVAAAFSELCHSLRIINDRERNVVGLITAHLDETITTLEHAHHETKGIRSATVEETKHEAPGLEELETIGTQLITLIRRYKEIVRREEDILAIENELMAVQDENKWKLYLVRLESFSVELREVADEYRSVGHRKKREIVALQKSIEELRAFSLRKPATAYFGPSVVSAIVRVFGANTLSQAILMCFGRVNFWEFTILTTVFVTGINFTDYYFGWATRLSGRIAKFLRIVR